MIEGISDVHVDAMDSMDVDPVEGLKGTQDGKSQDAR